MNDEIHSPAAKRPDRRLRRATAIAGAGILAGLIAAAIGGVASAQSVTITQVDDPAPVLQVAHAAQDDDRDDNESGHDDDYEFPPEDEAVFDQYDQCLADAGLTDDVDEETLDEATVESAFEQCDPILDNLSEDFAHFEISAEDEAVFERYEQCLTDAGVEVEMHENEADLDEATVEAAFEQCDPILDNLSDEFQEGFGEFDGFELSPADEVALDEFDQCLVDAGLGEGVDEDSLDDATVDAAFERCDPILDNLSEVAQELFEGCDEE